MNEKIKASETVATIEKLQQMFGESESLEFISDTNTTNINVTFCWDESIKDFFIDSICFHCHSPSSLLVFSCNKEDNSYKLSLYNGKISISFGTVCLA